MGDQVPRECSLLPTDHRKRAAFGFDQFNAVTWNGPANYGNDRARGAVQPAREADEYLSYELHCSLFSTVPSQEVCQGVVPDDTSKGLVSVLQEWRGSTRIHFRDLIGSCT